jgi:hypothetical protein
LRLAFAALIILAIARPMLGANDVGLGNTRPLLIVLDDGWGAARDWQKRMAYLSSIVANGEQQARLMALATTTPKSRNAEIRLDRASALKPILGTLAPQALNTDRVALLERLRKNFAGLAGLEIIWLSDGLDAGTAETFAEGLAALANGGATVSVVAPHSEALGAAISAAAIGKGGIRVTALRPSAATGRNITLRAVAGNGRNLAEQPLDFGLTDLKREAVLNLPLELRNELARIEIVAEHDAGAVRLVDDRWRRKAVGIATGASLELEQPLLSPLYYVTRALEPFAELREPADDAGALGELIAGGLSMLVLADIGIIPASSRDSIVEWVENGGVLVRFAGPRLAGGNDDLVPVELRSGGRELGSALSWEEPQAIAAFEEGSPFAELAIDPDVRIRRQVLAEPSADLPDRIWANLADGTPLITAAPRGKGLLVLFHVTANSDWSNLPLSGLFVDMLRRLLDLAPGVGSGESAKGQASTAAAAYTPSRALNGFGELSDMPADAAPIPAQEIDKTLPSPRHPAGLYLRGGATRALNVAVDEAVFRALGTLPSNIRRLSFEASAARSLAGPLLAAALMLFILDTLVAMTLAGVWQRLRLSHRSATVTLVFFAMIFAGSLPGLAQDHPPSSPEDVFAIEATTTTRLAYVATGDKSVDDLSLDGLRGLTSILKQRTAIEPGEPMAVDIERDEIVFFPLLYWPLTADAPQLSREALAKIDKYMKHGGTILFDTRDASSSARLGYRPRPNRCVRCLPISIFLPLSPFPRTMSSPSPFT